MRKFKFEKLVRDKIEKRIKSRGANVDSFVLDDKQYIEELKNKLLEETKEFVSAERKKLIEELADVQEVINYLLLTLDVDKEKLEEKQRAKIKERGSFNRRIYIRSVEVQNDDPWVDYYSSRPHKYPEVGKEKAERRVKLGRYRHFKGKEYEVLGVARHSETLEKLIVYRALYDSGEFGPNALWLSPKEMFLGVVKRDGKKMPRFIYID